MTDSVPTVLIIDDHPNNLKVAVEHLRAYDFTIRTARDGTTGVERARAHPPDLILLDIEMPGIDGYEACRRLKMHPETSGIPVIFMTARTYTDAKIRGFEVGGVDYITKPFDASELIARVRIHVELSRLRLDLQTQVHERTVALERELSLREQHLDERAKLLDMLRAQGEQLRIQSEQIRDMTFEWMEARDVRDADLGSMLHTRVTKRLQLVQMHLEQATNLAQSTNDERTRDIRAHIEEASSLLKPALDMTGEVEHELKAPAQDQDMAREHPLLVLSPREYEVLKLIVEGCTVKQIATTIGVARTTVSTYRTRMCEKLGVENTTDLIRLAISRGWLLNTTTP